MHATYPMPKDCRIQQHSRALCSRAIPRQFVPGMSYRSVVVLHYIAHIHFCRGYLFRSFSVLLLDLGQDPAAPMSAIAHPIPHPAPHRPTYSLSRKRWNSSSPTLMGEPPYCSHHVSTHASQGRGNIRMSNIPEESAPCRRRTRPWARACHPCRGRRGRRPGPWPR